MSTHSSLPFLKRHLPISCCLLLLPTLLNTAKASDNSANLGFHLKPARGTAPEMHIDSIISPDGAALPLGSGTAADGETLFMTECAACHGMGGKQTGNAIVGGTGSISTQKPLKTVGSYWPHATTLYDYIARAMPYDKQKSLTPDEVYSITAYILKLNYIVKKDDVMDKNSLPKVIMPNVNGFNELQ
jgi:cytochrome c